MNSPAKLPVVGRVYDPPLNAPPGSDQKTGQRSSLPHSPIASGATIPLSFIGAGITVSLVGVSWLLAAPGLLLLPHIHPHVVAFAHVWLLGVLLTICFGAVYQLMPVIANTAFTGPRQAWAHLVLHLAGVAFMVSAFLRGRMDGVAIGGTSVLLGLLLFGWSVLRTLRAATRIDAILVSFGCAAGWLVVTALAGLLLALNLRFAWWPIDVLALLRSHAHLGVIGFFLTLLQGAMFRLVPMFTLGVLKDTRQVRNALILSQLGLVVLAPALAWQLRGLELAGAALLLGSFFVTAIELKRVLATRKKRLLEPGLRGFFSGLGFLALAALFGTILIFAAQNLRAALAYGTIAVLGGVLMAIEGMLCKIVPFLVWMRVYGPLVGRTPVPQATTLGLSRCEHAWVPLHASSVLLLGIGAAFERPLVLGLGAIAFASGHALLIASLGAAGKHCLGQKPQRTH